MILPISDQYRISSDRYQWVVQKRRTRTKGGRKISDWQAQSYYPTLPSALAQLGERMVRESEANKVADALAAINDVATTLSLALSHVIEANHGSSKADRDDG